jgi:hypothetical protein
VGEQLDAEGIGVSPVINRAMNFRQFLVELCECFDAYPTYDPQGRLGLALVRTPTEVSVAIGSVDLVDAPTLNPQGWHDTFNETFIRFTDRDHRFEESWVAYRDRGNSQITQAVLIQTLSRLWITRQSVAQKMGNAAGRAAAKPLLSGSMRVRKSSGTNLTVGGTFALNFPQSGVNGVLCRVERLTLPAPGQGEVAVSFIEDTGFFNAAHYAAEAETPQVVTVFEVQERAYRPLAPLNLRVAGDGYNPTYGTVADCDRSWYRSSEEPVTQVLAPEIDQTVLEVRTMGGVLAGTFEFSGGTGPKTITNAQLVAALGSEIDFRLRAWFVRSGYRSLSYDEVIVRKM